LLKFLPDLGDDLQRFGVNVPHSRSSYEIEQGAGKITHTWMLHGAGSAANLNAILEQFSATTRFTSGFEYDLPENQYGGRVSFAHGEGEVCEFKFPCCRERMDHAEITYAHELDTHEIADCFIVAYQLSMLSRYFPDLWIACLESHGAAANLIEQTISVLTSKVPIVALSMLTNGGAVVSTHLPPWR
jgi:hypothetical protein